MRHMQVKTLHLLPPTEADAVKAHEKAHAQGLQRQGKWLHLWRIVGEYANVSIFDVASHDELHALQAAGNRPMGAP